MTYQTHKRNKLKTKKVNILEELNQEKIDNSSFKQQSTKFNNIEDENLANNIYKKQENRVSMEESAVNDSYPDNEIINVTKSKGFAKSLRRIGLKNKLKK